MMDGSFAVELVGIGKTFPGVIANHDITLRVRSGTIHAIVGENGAGKSTLMNTLYGMHQPDEGTISVFGHEAHFKSPTDAIAAGVGMVHQHFMLADNLTVVENIILGAEPAEHGVLKLSDAKHRLAELSRSIGAHVDLDALVATLGVGQRQRVEILKVLYRGAKVLILDEPTAVLVPQEVDELFVTLRQLVADGSTIIFISHKLDEVLKVSDEITVIRDGTTVATVAPGDINRRKLAELMVGSELPDPSGRNSTVGNTPLLTVTDLDVHADDESKLVVDGATFTVHNAEVLGIAGIEGNGQFELCEAILGLRPISRGTIELDGTDLTHLSVHHRHQLGISYIPFDRHREGLLLYSPLWENTMLGREETLGMSNGPFISGAGARRDCQQIVDRFSVRTPGIEVPAFALSGGNQQKLVVGRELSSETHVLIAAHPTRGVDVGAQAAIWDELRASRDKGVGVLLISADLEELIGLSDRIAVIFDGKITAVLDPATATPELLGSYMTGEMQGAA
ncbi:MAG TPA: ABC transporter ATP-binding protein [Ilumatobacteraceae bacterium]|nr:ABC transporter ATP-binding protein [Ilumatobacteraceae bacterium]